MKWLTNYYIIESVNLIIHKKNNHNMFFNKMFLSFVFAFLVKVLLQNIMINSAFIIIKNIIFPLCRWDFYVYNVELFNKHRILKDFINQLVLC